MADVEKRMMESVNTDCGSGIDSATVKVPESGNKSGTDNADKPIDSNSNNAGKTKRHGIDNLKPQNTRTKEEQRQIAIQGGKASGEARRKKKAIREVCETLLSMQANSGLKAKINPDIELPEGATVYDVLVASMAQEAIDGNVKAAEFIRDSAGDKPTDKSEITAAVMTDKDRELMEIIERRMSAGDGQKPD